MLLPPFDIAQFVFSVPLRRTRPLFVIDFAVSDLPLKSREAPESIVIVPNSVDGLPSSILTPPSGKTGYLDNPAGIVITAPVTGIAAGDQFVDVFHSVEVFPLHSYEPFATPRKTQFVFPPPSKLATGYKGFILLAFVELVTVRFSRVRFASVPSPSYCKVHFPPVVLDFKASVLSVEVPVRVSLFVIVCVLFSAKVIVFPPRPLATRVSISLLPVILTFPLIVRLLKVFEPLNTAGALSVVVVAVSSTVPPEAVKLPLLVQFPVTVISFEVVVVASIVILFTTASALKVRFVAVIERVSEDVTSPSKTTLALALMVPPFTKVISMGCEESENSFMLTVSLNVTLFA